MNFSIEFLYRKKLSIQIYSQNCQFFFIYIEDNSGGNKSQSVSNGTPSGENANQQVSDQEVSNQEVSEHNSGQSSNKDQEYDPLQSSNDEDDSSDEQDSNGQSDQSDNEPNTSKTNLYRYCINLYFRYSI